MQCDTQPDYVDVLVIGNGPSGICLSLLLSGYWPYFSGRHPNPVLREKLNENKACSLLEQDLEYLSHGLQGRSHNPLALLFDTLNHPDADLGETHPSSLLWKKDEQRAVSHLVVGSGDVGGLWCTLQGSKVLTLSHKDWLELPVYRFEEWEEGQTDRELGLQSGKEKQGSFMRAPTYSVSDYYRDYVKELHLEQNFLSHFTVEHVEPLEAMHHEDVGTSAMLADFPIEFDDLSYGAFSVFEIEEKLFMSLTESSPRQPSCCCCCSSEGSSGPCCCFNIDSGVSSGESTPMLRNASAKSLGETRAAPRWSVRGSLKREDGSVDTVHIQARNVVLASGCSGCPNQLGIPGEDLPFVYHSFTDAVPFLSSLRDRSLPVLVVGAGLSAADMIMLAMSKGLHVIHTFYNDPRDHKLIFTKLAPSLYPEYSKIYSLMKGEAANAQYTPFPKHKVVSFSETGSCTLVSNVDGRETQLPISTALVMIGSTANLGFLSDKVPPLGDDPVERISPRNNPVDVDPITFETEQCKGLFAMGPLVGDNFVRFLLGGALGIARKVWKDRLNSV